MKCNRRPHAFTLIELLVVLSIISMLMSIMLPSLRKAKEQARQVVCLSNVRQFITTWSTYAMEYNERICSSYTHLNQPNPWDGGHVPGNRFNNWVADGPGVGFNPVCNTEQALRDGVLFDFAQTVDLYRCPSDHRRLVRSYSIAHAMGCPHNYEGERTYTTTLEVRSPSERMVFVDARAGTTRGPDGTVGNLGCFTPVNTVSDEWLGGAVQLSARHDGECNMGFADLHVDRWKWLDPRTIDYAQGGMSFSEFQATAHENIDLPRLKEVLRPATFR